MKTSSLFNQSKGQTNEWIEATGKLANYSFTHQIWHAVIKTSSFAFKWLETSISSSDGALIIETDFYFWLLIN